MEIVTRDRRHLSPVVVVRATRTQLHMFHTVRHVFSTVTGTIENLYTISVCLVHLCHHLGMSQDGIHPESLCATAVVVAKDRMRLYHLVLRTVGLETDGSIRPMSLLSDLLRAIPELRIHGKMTAFNNILHAIGVEDDGAMNPAGLLAVLRDVLCALDVPGKVRFLNTVVQILDDDDVLQSAVCALSRTEKMAALDTVVSEPLLDAVVNATTTDGVSTDGERLRRLGDVRTLREVLRALAVVDPPVSLHQPIAPRSE